MSELRLETLTMPTAQVGPENPLPPLFTVADIHASIDTAAAQLKQMRERMLVGLPS
jgi:hypothetical protein